MSLSVGDKIEAEPLNWQVNWLNMKNEKKGNRQKSLCRSFKSKSKLVKIYIHLKLLRKNLTKC